MLQEEKRAYAISLDFLRCSVFQKAFEFGSEIVVSKQSEIPGPIDPREEQTASSAGGPVPYECY